jgi:uncharacterized protein (DUF1330 family)
VCTSNATDGFSVGVSPDFSFPISVLIVANGMNIQLKTVAAGFAGVGIGVLAMHGLQGGQAKAPPAFVISNIEVTDPAGYQKYAEAAAAVAATYHGKILARGGKAVVFDGRAPQRVVVIEFPTLADAERWRSSPEFQKLKRLQQQSSKYIESFAIEGVQ